MTALRIYLIKADFSTFERPGLFKRTAFGRHIKITEKFEKLLKKQGCRTVYVSESDFKNYGDIRGRIGSCKCVLAFTDAKTFETNHRAEELTHSIMDAGVRVFLYTELDDNYNKNRLFSGLDALPNVHVLPKDIKASVQLIDSIMTKGT